MLGKQVRINITTVTNAKAIRKEERNGRKVIIVPSATLPDNVIMNGIKYPAAEIKKSFASLNRTPAPLGHPMINGKFVSARDPEGINLGWIGAWNENVRQKDGRVLLDKVIDVVKANESEGGKAVLAAIEKGEPIHTSTGLLCMLEPAANDATDHKSVAKAMVFDHDAILLNTEGAATPEQGVGMLVNETGEEEEIEVINSNLEAMDQEIDWAGTRLVEAVRRKADASVWQKMKDDILEAMGLKPEPKAATNSKETDMTDSVSKEQFDGLAKQVADIANAIKPDALAAAVTAAVNTAVKPLLDAQTNAAAEQKTKDDTEHAELVTIVVKANLLDEATAKATPLNTLRALKPKGLPGTAAALNAAPGTGGDLKSKFTAPKAEGK